MNFMVDIKTLWFFLPSNLPPPYKIKSMNLFSSSVLYSLLLNLVLKIFLLLFFAITESACSYQACCYKESAYASFLFSHFNNLLCMSVKTILGAARRKFKG